MAFPTNPNNLQTHTEYGRTYQYFTATGTWLATRGDWDYVESGLDLSLITGNSPVTLGNGATYTPISTPYVVTNRVWQATEYNPPEIPVPTVAITGPTGNLIESSTRSFIVYLTDDYDNIASLNIVSGGGSLSSNTISNGNSVIYTPANVASNTSVTLRATVSDIRGDTVTSDLSFTVADTPPATVGISGPTTVLEKDLTRDFTVSQSGDLDGNIQVSIISGQGTLSHSSRTSGQVVTYSNPNYYDGDVTIRARAINYDGEITDATITFTANVDEILLIINTFDVITTFSSIIPAADILVGSVDEYSDNQDPLVLVSVQNPVGGTVTFDGVNVEFTSTTGISDPASFEYTVRNTEAVTEDGTVTMNVLPIPPIITIADTFDLRQGETLLSSSTAYLSNDISSVGNTLSIQSVQSPTGGTVSLSGNTVEFVSTGLAGQPAGFEYTVTDGSTTSTGDVFINITPLPEIESFIFTNTADALNATATTAPPGPSEIFNTWDRFDGSAAYAGGTTPGGQAADWRLESDGQGGQRIVQPTNTTYGGGFVSPEDYDDYTFEGTIYSTAAGDNDTIGLIAAYVRIGSTNYTLAAVRTKGGQSPGNHWGVIYTENGPWVPTWTLANINMSSGSTSSVYSTDQAGIRIIRDGDTITFYSTYWNDVNNFQIASEVVVDLNSDSRLAKFKDPKPYGYYSHSQGGSTYADIEFNGGVDAETIIDAQTGTVYEWDGSSWQTSSISIQDTLGYIRKVKNPDTGDRFLIKQNTVDYLGREVATSNYNASEILSEQQIFVINSVTGGSGVPSSTQVVGMYQVDAEEVNILNGLPSLTTSGNYSGGSQNVGSGSYFSDNGLNINALSLAGGYVAFANGTVARIDGATDGSISYTPTTNYTLYDKSP